MGERKKMKKRINWQKVVRSKTLWINLIALIALMAQLEFGFVIGPEEQASAIVMVNLLLRVVTKEGLFEDEDE